MQYALYNYVLGGLQSLPGIIETMGHSMLAAHTRYRGAHVLTVP